MDMPIKWDSKDDRNTQEIPVKPDSRKTYYWKRKKEDTHSIIKAPIMGMSVSTVVFGITVTENTTTGVITGDTAGGSLKKQP